MRAESDYFLKFPPSQCTHSGPHPRAARCSTVCFNVARVGTLTDTVTGTGVPAACTAVGEAYLMILINDQLYSDITLRHLGETAVTNCGHV
jgi:hypothetical protein